MGVPIARPVGESVAGGLRRSARAVQILLGAAILISAIATYAIVGVLRPRVESLNSAVAGLNQAMTGMEQERVALILYLNTGDRSQLASYSRAKAVVAGGDAEVLRSGLGGHDILSKLLAVRSAEQAWTVGWADPVIAGAEPNTSGVAATEARGNQLFSAYLSASSQATLDLGARARTASSDEWKAAIAGLAGAAVLVVAAGLLASDHRRLAANGLRTGVAPLVVAARQIESGDAANLDSVVVPSELEELARVVLGMARELESLREAIDMGSAQADVRARKLLQVLELTRSIGGNLSLRPVMDSVALAALRLTGAARAVLWISVDGELRPMGDTGGGQPLNGSEPPDAVVQAATYGRSTRSWTEELLATTAGQSIVDLRDSNEGEAALTAVTPRLAVPMTITGRVIGVVELRGGEVAQLSADDIELVETLASNGASAIEAARAHGVTESLSMTDPLTRLPNRRQLEHDLATETERARRYRRSSALIMLDVDGFKAFNDRYGHQAGDQVLAQFGELLADAIRSSDSAYRYGGEEFAVLVREASVEAAVDLAERLRQRVAERFSVLPPDAPVTASFGVVGVEQVEPEPASLIRAADEALYAAKERGRNRVVAFK
ncbi:MAG TPA: sensor domain-containing diguanylate cyclase [Acidimicrobiales bacterium]|nr:sensor domain-containing diguanylate cyclase [Acidimicrobiales bacterium]